MATTGTTKAYCSGSQDFTRSAHASSPHIFCRTLQYMDLTADRYEAQLYMFLSCKNLFLSLSLARVYRYIFRDLNLLMHYAGISSSTSFPSLFDSRSCCSSRRKILLRTNAHLEVAKPLPIPLEEDGCLGAHGWQVMFSQLLQQLASSPAGKSSAAASAYISEM